jgi:hypothetical protein
MAFAFTVLTLLSLTGSALGGTLFGNSAGYLKAVDLRAGSIEVIGPVDNEEYWVGDLTFSPHKELYGVARHYNGDPDKLVKIDLETAEIIEIGTLDMSGVRGIAFDSNGVLYGAGGEEYRGLIQIDPETCTVTQIGRYRLGKAVVTGLAISPQDELYGVVNEMTTVVCIELTERWVRQPWWTTSVSSALIALPLTRLGVFSGWQGG